MPPKHEKSHEEDEKKMQAIVLADSFQTRFMPLTHVRPRCLLPLANVPLIEYTLEFLAQSSLVNEVFIMCCSHADQIQNYIDGSKWVSTSSPFKKIQTIASKESRSVGDAMRDIDSRSLITDDFILVSGDVVTNLDLTNVLEEHKKHKQGDRDYICTMVLKQASPLHRARSMIEPGCFILEKGTDRCLYYQDLPPPISGKKTSVNIDPEVLEDVEEFVINNDLIDCHVDICTAQVPTIFQENFDYQTLRSDFVRGVLGSDLLKKHIFAYKTIDDYSARVESWQTYDGISQDVLERWCYPIVPERNLLDDQTYSYGSHHVYKEDGVRLSQSCTLKSRVVIGKDSFIGDGSKIEGSVIGRSCKIGNGVIVENSYIWDGAIIEDGCVIKHAIVASDSIIRKNSILNPGCVIGFDVIIDENVIVPNNAKIMKDLIKSTGDFISSEDEEEDSEVELPSDVKGDKAVVGLNGVGFLFEEDSDDEEDMGNIVSDLLKVELSDSSIASSTITVRHKKKKRTQSTASGFYSEDEVENFDTEAIATVERAMENNHDLDTALLELNTLRMSMNVSYHEVRESTTRAMFKRTNHFVETGTLTIKEAVDKIFSKWGIMYKRQVFEEADQIDLLLIVQKLCFDCTSEWRCVMLMYIINVLYDIEVLEEDSILKWWTSPESEAMADVREKTTMWIKWLQEAEESDEDEDGDSSDNGHDSN